MNKVYVIAEAGVNHNGSLETAKLLIDAARDAGADAVKFQTFKADKLVSKTARKADYQKATSGADESQYDMIRKLELDEAAHRELVRHCKARGIEFLSTAFDSGSVDLLRSLGVRTWKIPSGEITNLPFLRQVGAFDEDVILSTGMATLGEVEAAIIALERAGTPRDRIVALHCTTEYPAPIADVNLRAMLTMRDAFQVRIGYSDHTSGIEVPIAAVAMGAILIEKHFTLDRGMQGPDHQASLEPAELGAMIRAIRSIELALGDGIKYPRPSELKNRAVARKSIVAARLIRRGEILSTENLTTKRPGDGISPMEWDSIVGREASRDYQPDEKLE
jgi:N,N'-diacetyllegionaminate synthase